MELSYNILSIIYAEHEPFRCSLCCLLHLIRLPFAFRVFGDPFRAHSYETEEQSALSTSVHSSSGNSSGSDDWIEPAAYALNSTALLTREHRNVLDAFRLLQKDPNVQVRKI